ncbi:MAG: hypothetical protein ACE5HW_02280, partial [Candidatus Methanofastidiosia archaeon]
QESYFHGDDQTIAIVGGGPVGCYLASKLRENYILMEEHPKIGEPVKCAGLVSGKLFDAGISKKSIINRIDGALIFLKNDHFRIKRKGIAIVINRKSFDERLSQGLEISLNEKFLNFKKKDEKFQIKTSKRKFETEKLIGCDGPFSKVRSLSNLNFKMRFYKAVQYTIKGDFEKNYIQMHLKKPFFTYLIPENEEVARLGCISENPKKELNKFIKERKLCGKILSRLGGVIPIGFGKTVGENIALIGDAACQVKPMTGGGLYFGLKASEIAAKCLNENSLEEYEEKWKKEFGFEIRLGLHLRRIYERMPEKDIQRAFKILKENIDLIEKCDFDHHSTVLREFLWKRDFFKLVGIGIRNWF